MGKRYSKFFKISTLQIVEVVLQELDGFTVNVPELELLKRYHSDATLWIARLNDILVNIHKRKDQHNVIDELNCILKDGASLRIQGFFLRYAISLLQ